MNKYVSKIIIAAFVLAFLLPIQVFAQGDDSFQLDTQGNVTLSSSHAARERISSLQFSLKIDSDSADKVEFQFNESKAQITEFRYHEATGVLNVYIAGTEALFAENAESLTIGRVVVLDSGQNDTPATVSVVADSFQYVYGGELKKVEELQVPEAVTINSGSSDSGGSQIPPAVDNPQGTGGSSSGSQSADNSNNTQSQGQGDSNNTQSQGQGSSNNTQSQGQGSSNSTQSQGQGSSNSTQSHGNGNPSGDTAADSQNTSSSQNTTSGVQSSGSNTSNRQPQSSDSNGLDSKPPEENYSRLKQAYENARRFKEGDYSSESYEALQAAMAKAEEVLGDPNATSEEIEEALLELENAIGALAAKEDAADDSQQSGEQETGETLEQIIGEGIEETEDASNGGILSTLLLTAGILVLVGCVIAAAVIKIRSEQSYKDD